MHILHKINTFVHEKDKNPDFYFRFNTEYFYTFTFNW